MQSSDLGCEHLQELFLVLFYFEVYCVAKLSVVISLATKEVLGECR